MSEFVLRATQLNNAAIEVGRVANNIGSYRTRINQAASRLHGQHGFGISDIIQRINQRANLVSTLSTDTFTLRVFLSDVIRIANEADENSFRVLSGVTPEELDKMELLISDAVGNNPGAIAKLMDFISNLAKSTKDAYAIVDLLLQSYNVFALLSNALPNLKNLPGWLGIGVSAGTSIISSIAGMITGDLSITDAIGNVTASVSTSAAWKGISFIAKFVAKGAVKGSVKPGLGNVVGAIAGLVVGIGSFVFSQTQWGKDLHNWISSNVSNFLGNVGNAVQGAWNTVTNWFDNTAQNIGNWIGGAAQVVGDTVADWWNTTTNVVNDAWNTATNVVKDVGQAVVNTVTAPVRWVRNLFRRR
ncbi:MAG: hypothetical protein FWG68_11660 [Defluviitaleaceae bacterium]|nr:hypothetical protein [Defluviitaleaceae bacterium]